MNEQIKKGAKLDEHMVAYLAIELLRIFEALRMCRVIHGDVKPDNFLFRGL